MKFTTRQVVVAGLLTALTVLLGSTPIGLIPVPTPAGAVTIMQVPVVLAGIFEGPIVSAFVGLLFGLFTLRFMGDPRVVIPARLLIGLASWATFHLVYKLQAKRGNTKSRSGIAGAVSGIVGSLTNTVGTLSLAAIFGYYTWEAVAGMAVVHGLPEMVVAAVIVGTLVTALDKFVVKKS